ncbi:MAG TPA: glycoside hydrolase family 3 protein, partial [Acidobacteriaceae bacterium]|nr:glycoside hydrolase family 3 protein [Acidobacteriaceae bacterium]
LIMPWARIRFMNVNDPDYLRLREEMRQYHVGGFGVTVFADGPTLAKSEPYEAAQLTNSLQRDSKYPLLFGADLERGLAVRLNGATSFPAAMAFGAINDPALARDFGRITAEEARAIGIQWNWFPVADTNSNPANPIINTRSFSEDPQRVSDFITAYIKGAREAGLLTTAKHFPGHGDTDTDTHLTLARINASRERLDKLELVPFRAAIAAGVDSIMTAHVTVPALEPDPNKPASISHNVITGLLKEQLGFKGLVVTDALDMGGLMRVFPGSPAEVSAQEAVAAIQAGNDMVIIPADLGGAYHGLLDAVHKGIIPQKRLDESVLKVLRIKASVGLDQSRFVNTAAIYKVIAKPESLELAQRISDRAITLAVDRNHLVPINPAAARSGTLAVIFADDARSSEGAHLFVRQLHQRLPNAEILYVDQYNAAHAGPDVLAAATKAQRIIAVAEAVPSARRAVAGASGGSAGLSQDGSTILASLIQQAGDRTILAAFGNPYVGASIPGVGTYLCTFSNANVSATSLSKALFGEIPIHGRLPVTLPNIAERGTGLDR